MKRFSQRAPKNYVWSDGVFAGQLNNATVLTFDLVLGSDYAQNAALSAQDHVCNIQRVIGDVTFSVPPAGFDDILDFFIYGPIVWALLIVDEDDATVYDPEGNALQEEGLGVGITECIGLLVDTNAFVGGTGLQSTFGHAVKPSTSVHFDIRTNRRLSGNEALKLFMTRTSNPQMSLAGDLNYEAQSSIRTLIKLP